jgi:hypothetical protein
LIQNFFDTLPVELSSNIPLEAYCKLRKYLILLQLLIEDSRNILTYSYNLRSFKMYTPSFGAIL